LVHPTTGEITVNFDPQKGMKGYFDFAVVVTDEAGHNDEAHVQIYLLRADQVRFIQITGLHKQESLIFDRQSQYT